MVSRPVIVLRLSTAVLFVAVSVSFTWQSVASFILLIITFFAIGNRQSATITKQKRVTNPFKYIKETSMEELAEETQTLLKDQLLDYVTYDAEQGAVMNNFEPLEQQTECIFAKKSKMWGSQAWDERLSFELNIVRSLPSFFLFSSLCSRVCLDGFLFELPGDIHGTSLQVFGKAVRKLLTILSDNDPAQRRCMDRRIDSSSWVFEFNKETFFITTFAPFYPDTHSRHSFGSRDCYVLFQPEVSFARHDLPPDTPHTKWTCPKTVRDRIRVAFRDAGRGYDIRNTTAYPMAHDIVKSTDGSLIHWWLPDEGDEKKYFKVFDL